MALQALAGIQIKQGTPEEIEKLKEMLQCSVFGTASPPSGQVEVDANGVVTITGTVASEFGMRMKQIIDDSANNVELYIEKAVPEGVIFVGGFRRGRNSTTLPGDGKQSIDVCDLMLMPKTPGTGAHTLQSLLIHELVEAWDGLKNNHKFNEAHDAGIAAEEAVIKAQNMGMEYKRVDPDEIMGNMIKIHHRKVATGERRHIKFTLDSAAQVTTITHGLVANFRREFISNGWPDSRLRIIKQYDSRVTVDVIPNTEELGGVDDISIDRKGRFWCCSSSQNIAARLNVDGDIEMIYTHADVTTPRGVAFNLITGELFVAGDNAIVVFAEGGEHLRTLRPESLALAAGLALDTAGDLYVANHGGGNVLHLNPAGEVLRTITHPDLGDPAGIAFASLSQELFVVNNSGSRVLVFEANGTFARVFASGPELAFPWGITLVGGTGDPRFAGSSLGGLLEGVVVANTGGGYLVVYRPDGTVQQLRTNASHFPSTVAVRSVSEDLSPLAIHKNANLVTVNWEVKDPDLPLVFKADLGPNDLWRVVPRGPLLTNGSYSFDVSNNQASGFFQLQPGVELPCKDGVLRARHAYSVCSADGMWHVVEDDYYECPPPIGLRRFRVGDVNTGQPCTNLRPAVVGQWFRPLFGDASCVRPRPIGELSVFECPGNFWIETIYTIEECEDRSWRLRIPATGTRATTTPCDQSPPPPSS